MTTVLIKEVPVKFPFPPYEIQKNYMEKVIDCLETKQNGVLESPTGTGKTLSLLCASLAWLETKKSQYLDLKSEIAEEDEEKYFEMLFKKREEEKSLRPPTIIYSSRTHSQLHQAMQEMKRTSYNHMKACVLGSRGQMCINEDVIIEPNNSTKVHLCKAKVKHKKCIYHSRVERQKENHDLVQMNIVDMEDLMELGRCNNFCPYYMTRELKKKADIVFMPYNYLLDPITRNLLSIELKNCIIILDEAHNIEKICEDSASIQIKSTEMTSCVEDITAVIDALLGPVPPHDEAILELSPKDLRELNEAFIKFGRILNNIQLTKLAVEGTYFDGDYIFEMLENSGINEQNFVGIIDLLETLNQFFANTTIPHLQRSTYNFELFTNLLTIISHKRTPEYRQKIKECFKVHVTEEKVKKPFGREWLSQRFTQREPDEYCRVLSLWCFSPGFAMNMLMDQDVHCVILTSGTLAPLKPLISELEIDVGFRIENPHIVKGDQVCVKVLTKGPDQEPLNSNFQNRNNPKYLRSLGLVISNLVRCIPHGVLIFFPSYAIMEKCEEFWQDNGTWSAINAIKPIYVEPKDKASFTNAINDYYSKIKDPIHKGAIFMGVCRGKVAEGLDFADINGRAVFITGLPYPPLKDARVILKKRYLDFRSTRDRSYLRGDEWYSLEATRAVNQAIGRVIRHKNDYGAIILLDSRFDNPKVRSNLSAWLQQHINNMKNFGEAIRNIRSFFQHAEEKLPLPEPKPAEICIDLTDDFYENYGSTSANEGYESGLVKIHKRERNEGQNSRKRTK